MRLWVTESLSKYALLCRGKTREVPICGYAMCNRYRRHFRVTTMDSAAFWGKNRRQQVVVARGGVRDIMQAICRGHSPDDLGGTAGIGALSCG